MNASVPARGSILKAGLMGGMVAALLHATPYITKLNTCCCALTVAAGIFAAWILQADSNRSAGAGRCGVAGGLAGLLGGVVGVPLAAIVSRLAFGVGALEAEVAATMAQAGQLMETWGTAPGTENITESIVRASVGLEFSAWTIFVLIVTGLIFSFFGLLGGLLGGVLLRPAAGSRGGPVPPPPPARMQQPPPPPPPRPPDDEPPQPPSPGEVERPLGDDQPEEGPLAHEELPFLPAPSESLDDPPPTAAGPESGAGRDTPPGA